MPSMSLSDAQNAIPTARAIHGLSYSLRARHAVALQISRGKEQHFLALSRICGRCRSRGAPEGPIAPNGPAVQLPADAQRLPHAAVVVGRER